MFGYALLRNEDAVCRCIKNIIMTIVRKIKCLTCFARNQDDSVSELSREKVNYIERKSPEDALVIYGDSILRLAVSYLHNLSDAEDILQDTLIKYIEKEEKFTSKEHEKAWLLRVSGNLSKNKIKYNNIRKASPVDEQIIGDGSPELNYVWEAIKQLPDKYREVIHLYYQEGYSTYEIGDILSKKESTIRSLMHRGRKILKGILREEYDFCE